ncbi:hypothetical protein Hypma_005704 [Hypsizygus marmoreus]|uniref:Uncharacterized protein n=1 Tax=Hypsizygus marmoreus TaxID=39966 RepID=A0A369K3Z3_HYPMA|nr:hypothetical protein Hypma_005704 [Hypsizygus marmoreus]
MGGGGEGKGREGMKRWRDRRSGKYDLCLWYLFLIGRRLTKTCFHVSRRGEELQEGVGVRGERSNKPSWNAARSTQGLKTSGTTNTAYTLEGTGYIKSTPEYRLLQDGEHRRTHQGQPREVCHDPDREHKPISIPERSWSPLGIVWHRDQEEADATAENDTALPTNSAPRRHKVYFESLAASSPNSTQTVTHCGN